MRALRGVIFLAFTWVSLTAQLVVNRAETVATVTIANAGLGFAPAQTSPFSGNGTLNVSGVCTVSSDVQPPVEAQCSLPISGIRSDQTLRRRKLQTATPTPTAASPPPTAASPPPTAAPSAPETEAPTPAPEIAPPTAAPSAAAGSCSVLTLSIPASPVQVNGLNVTMANDLRLVITAIRNGLIDEQLCASTGAISGDPAPIAASLNTLFANGYIVPAAIGNNPAAETNAARVPIRANAPRIQPPTITTAQRAPQQQQQQQQQPAIASPATINATPAAATTATPAAAQPTTNDNLEGFFGPDEEMPSLGILVTSSEMFGNGSCRIAILSSARTM
eukprot:7135-Heterococcus_DN1.PRE.2